MLKKLVLVAVVLTVASSAMAAKSSKKELTGVVNINTATVQELTMIPGVGKSKAEAVVAQRQSGPFKTTQDIEKVKGIGPKMFAKIVQYITVEGPTTAKAVKVQSASAPQATKTAMPRSGI
ncbi:MAG: hypothetical protein COV46_00460 [Deltaproteobacteria bacterium CG11_big_fil_rev_8_21_14_0_20_49_13]|nr:MAG: hypothetical protein COV46_00460 [Deltaproteobacteria bacterium CG11_big_fil_rev_8_21_14_0_20_49_13]